MDWEAIVEKVRNFIWENKFKIAAAILIYLIVLIAKDYSFSINYGAAKYGHSTELVPLADLINMLVIPFDIGVIVARLIVFTPLPLIGIGSNIYTNLILDILGPILGIIWIYILIEIVLRVYKKLVKK